MRLITVCGEMSVARKRVWLASHYAHFIFSSSFFSRPTQWRDKEPCVGQKKKEQEKICVSDWRRPSTLRFSFLGRCASILTHRSLRSTHSLNHGPTIPSLLSFMWCGPWLIRECGSVSDFLFFSSSFLSPAAAITQRMNDRLPRRRKEEKKRCVSSF